MFEIGQSYRFSYIEQVMLDEQDVDLSPFEDDEDEQILIGETCMVFKFDDGTVAAHFVLDGMCDESVWRCGYVAECLEV